MKREKKTPKIKKKKKQRKKDLFPFVTKSIVSAILNQVNAAYIELKHAVETI